MGMAILMARIIWILLAETGTLAAYPVNASRPPTIRVEKEPQNFRTKVLEALIKPACAQPK